MSRIYIILTVLALSTYSCKSDDNKIKGKWLNVAIIDSSDPLILDFLDENSLTIHDGNLAVANYIWKFKGSIIEISSTNNDSAYYKGELVAKDTLVLFNPVNNISLKLVPFDKLINARYSDNKDIKPIDSLFGLWNTKNLYNNAITEEIYFDFFSKNKAIYNYRLSESDAKISQPIKWKMLILNDLQFLRLDVLKVNYILINNFRGTSFDGIIINNNLDNVEFSKIDKTSEVNIVKEKLLGRWKRMDKLSNDEEDKLIDPNTLLPNELFFDSLNCKNVFYNLMEIDKEWNISNDADKLILNNLENYHNDLIYIKEINHYNIIFTYNIKGIGKRDLLFKRLNN